MGTIFSHIVQKCLSHQNENIATEALAYMLYSYDQAHTGMMNLLRAFQPDLPALSFHTQVREGDMRPDIWGYEGSQPRAFIENKFWAGLTDNEAVKEWAVTEGILSTDGLSASNSSKRFERYVQFTGDENFGAWFGIHYALWKRYEEN